MGIVLKNVNITGGKMEALSKLQPVPSPAGWVRPADWLSMPTLTSADEEIAILHAVWNNDSNYAAFRCTTSAGN